MKVAILFGTGSGKSNRFFEIGTSIAQQLAGHELFACQQEFLPNAIPYISGDTYIANLENMANVLLDKKADLFITVGGDGLASYLSGYLIGQNADIPILGVAAGTANVGPIVTLNISHLQQLDVNNLVYETIGAIQVCASTQNGGEILGYGFNDVVIGDTFLSTADGNVVNISVERMVLHGEKMIIKPSESITADSFAIKKSNINISFSIAEPKQIIISPIEADNFYGRAITGGLCMSACSDYKAAVALLDEILISASADDKIAKECFLKCEHLLFKEGEGIELTGLSEKGHIVIDGNPFINNYQGVKFNYLPNLITVAKMGDKK